MGYAMADLQILDLILFAVGTFAAALVTGVAGFAFGIVAAAVWLYSLPPAQTTALIVAYGLIVQGISVWKLRRSIKPARLTPFLAGAVIGVPIGVELLRWTSPATLRISVGVVLVLFSLYSLVRPQLAPVTAGKAADGAIGVFNGVIGGATGLAGIALTIWCTLRGWPRDEQRATFQPIGVWVFLMTGLWLGGMGLVRADTLRLFVIGLPLLLAGTWVGLRLYARLDEAGFRKVVLGLLLISGLGPGCAGELTLARPIGNRRRMVAAAAAGGLGRCIARLGGAWRTGVRRRICRSAPADLSGRARLQRAGDRGHRHRDADRHGGDDALGRLDCQPAFPAPAPSCGNRSDGCNRCRLRRNHGFLAASGHRRCRHDEPDLG